MHNKTRRAVEETALAEGAVRIRWQSGGRHWMAYFDMPDGRQIKLAVSASGKIDPYKQRGWTRQAIRNAPRG